MLTLDSFDYSQEPKPYLEKLTLGMGLFIDVLFVTSFLTMQIYSRRYHYFEWKNNKFQFRIFFFLLALFKALWWFWYFLDDPEPENYTSIQSKMDITELLISLLFLRGFLLTLVILVFKDTNDLLEGISKLDNRVMVSRF